MFDMISKPRFTHDCDGCLFLGCYREHDVYFCPNCESFCGGSVILRYGDEGREYSSSPLSTALYTESGLTENSDIRKKVAVWLMREDMIKVSINQKTLDEKKLMWEDVWVMRKEES